MALISCIQNHNVLWCVLWETQRSSVVCCVLVNRPSLPQVRYPRQTQRCRDQDSVGTLPSLTQLPNDFGCQLRHLGDEWCAILFLHGPTMLVNPGGKFTSGLYGTIREPLTGPHFSPHLRLKWAPHSNVVWDPDHIPDSISRNVALNQEPPDPLLLIVGGGSWYPHFQSSYETAGKSS